MPIKIAVNEDLLVEATEAAGLASKEAVVEEALRRLIRHHARKKAWEELRGLGWEGDLDEMRRDIDTQDPATSTHQDAAE